MLSTDGQLTAEYATSIFRQNTRRKNPYVKCRFFKAKKSVVWGKVRYVSVSFLQRSCPVLSLSIYLYELYGIAKNIVTSVRAWYPVVMPHRNKAQFSVFHANL